MEEFLIAIVVVVLSALSSWAQKKRRAQEGADPDKPGTPPAAEPGGAPAEPFDWERELRRLLGGEAVMPAPSPPPLPPPVPAPRSPPTGPAPMVASSHFFEGEEEAGARAMAPMGESAQAFARGSHLSEKVQARFREMHATTERHVHGEKTAVRPRVISARTAVMQSLHYPETARNAMILCMVLGKPRALDKEN